MNSTRKPQNDAESKIGSFGHKGSISPHRPGSMITLPRSLSTGTSVPPWDILFSSARIFNHPFNLPRGPSATRKIRSTFATSATHRSGVRSASLASSLDDQRYQGGMLSEDENGGFNNDAEQAQSFDDRWIGDDDEDPQPRTSRHLRSP